MAKSKYTHKVVLDTNILHNDASDGSSLIDVFGGKLADIEAFLQENKIADKVKLCITEVILEERIQQKKERALSLVERANSEYERLHDVGIKIERLGFDSAHEAVIREAAQNALNDSQTEVLPVPKVSMDDLLKRALTKKRPFKSADNGFKDTLILLSIIEDAQKDGDAETAYVLVTKNRKDFSEEVVEEFQTKTKKTLHITDDSESLKELLDEELALSLDLKALHAKIKEAIKERAGTLILELNKYLAPRGRGDNWLLASTTVNFAPTILNSVFGVTEADSSESTQETKIVGYDLDNLEVQNISGASGDRFTVQGILTVVERIKADGGSEGASAYSPRLRSWHLGPSYKFFDFSLTYDKGADAISDIRFGLSYYHTHDPSKML